MTISYESPSSSTTKAIVVISDERYLELEKIVLPELGAKVKIKGFRPGKAPEEKIREQISEEDIREEVIRREMPSVMEKIYEEKKLEPIIRPRVELSSLTPMTLTITIVEEPEAKVAIKKVKTAWKKTEKEFNEEGTKNEKEKKEECCTSSDCDHASGSDAQQKKQQEENEKKAQQEQMIFDLIAENTTVELAPELIDDEAQAMVESHAHRLGQFGLKLEDWLKSQQKSLVDLIRELRPDGEKRLKIRYGMRFLINDLQISVSDEEMKTEVDELLKPLQGEEHAELRKMYEPGERLFDQFKEQKMVEKVLEILRG